MADAHPERDTPTDAPMRAWADARREIAQEPGNHRRLAIGCTAAVVVVVVSFFLLRVFVLR